MNDAATRMNRRAFHLAAASAVSTALPLAAIARMLDEPVHTGGLPVHFVYDTRVVESARDDAGFCKRITATHPFEGDITPIWFNTLDALWADNRIETLGVTRHSEFFVLSTLARERGYIVAETEEQADQISWLLIPGPRRR